MLILFKNQTKDEKHYYLEFCQDHQAKYNARLIGRNRNHL